MTAVIISSVIIGALAAHPLLRWARSKESFLNKLGHECAGKLLVPALILMALLIFILYTPAYTLIVFAAAMLVALIASSAASAIRNERRVNLFTLMVSEERVKSDRRSKRMVALHTFLFVMIFSTLATEALLATAEVGGVLYTDPELHAFIGGKRAAPMLLDSIESGDRRVSGLAAKSLIEMGKTEALIKMGEAAVPALIAAPGWMDVPYEWNYSTCCGNTSAKPVIKEGSARAEAIRALVGIGEPAIPYLLRALSGGWLGQTDAVEEALVQIGNPVILHLRNRLPLDNTDAFRTRAVRIMRRIGDPSTAPDLIAALSDTYYSVRWEAALGLRQMKHQAAVPALIDALTDYPSTMRCLAARALGEIGDRKAVPALLVALSSYDEETRVEARKAIEKIGDPLPALIEGLKSDNVAIRRQAVSALAGFRDAQTAPALIDSLADADPQVRQGAAERLGEKGQLKDRSTVAPLIAALSDVDSSVKKQAAQSLGLIGDPMAVRALVRELKKCDYYSSHLPQALMKALIKIGDASATSEIIEAIRKMAKGDWEWQGANLRNGLAGMGQRAAPFMTEALGDRDQHVRHLAASVLAEIGNADAIPAMEAAERRYHQPGFCIFCKALQDLKAK